MKVKQTDADRKILATTGHPQGPQFIGPRQVSNCNRYDEHRQYFYRTANGSWRCPEVHN